MKKIFYICCFLLFGSHIALSAQAITLFEQFNGQYDYLAIGNTLNPAENNGSNFCALLESSTAELNLNPDNALVKAYLYWAGSGPGDASVSLNGNTVTADDSYTVTYNSPTFGDMLYFSSYADITEIINTNGNGLYEFSDLDINTVLLTDIGYCANRTNFGGWSIYIIYEDASLPLNQISLFQGLEIINRNVQNLDITLSNINVLDNNNAKIGFLAWEGDNALNFGESLSINNNIISNPPLNFADNAFNGTNTFTNSNVFYNADLDVYNIENNINIGDNSASIRLTTGGLDENGVFQADLIIINNIITVLNSRLPDATISIDSTTVFCGGDNVELDYTVFNLNSTETLPANTPIAFYVGDTLVGQSHTLNPIDIGSSETNSISLTIPEELGPNVTVVASVDDTGAMVGIVDETNEDNNLNAADIELLVIPDVIILPGLIGCNEGFGISTYNLYDALIDSDLSEENISFFQSLEDLETETNAILNIENYVNSEVPQTIYIRRESAPCYAIFQFELLFDNCPPTIPQGFSPNDDNTNDWFNIRGLYDIFIEHRLRIYNRYGTLVFEGNNNKAWYGEINRGVTGVGNIVPVGTYYYILELNDSDYRPMVGWVYVNY
ncbi:T9SS type B sorting domain-containing protein [Winogradskyella aurantia]|uniref:T9SS type B sorting domain-containing protein n=1 Tax=Winogradskyella aurantia TaxID=1915063 RepID=UPI001F0AE7C5|nr:gliding motility-associated C-terminal domain-containing protein [Winogradskyella aurantia]